jgi:hypothetical protein
MWQTPRKLHGTKICERQRVAFFCEATLTMWFEAEKPEKFDDRVRTNRQVGLHPAASLQSKRGESV